MSSLRLSWMIRIRRKPTLTLGAQMARLLSTTDFYIMLKHLDKNTTSSFNHGIKIYLSPMTS